MIASESGLLNPRVRAWLLALLATLSFFCYWFLVAIALNPRLKQVYNVKGARYGGPLVWPSRLFHLAGISRVSRMWLYIAIMVILSLAWLGAIYLVRGDRRRSLTFIIVAAFALFAALFVFGPTFQSSDVFSYAFFGRAMTVYHRNPFLLIPQARPHDIFFTLIAWKTNASVYGPVFNYASYAITRLAGNNITSNVLGFKLLAFLSYAGTLPLVYALTKRASPGKENMALVITAWCPVLIMNLLGAGHNDALMVALILGGYLLYRKGYPLSGIAVVLLAAMVKIVAVLAVAPMLILYLRDGRGALSRRLLAAGATVVALPLVLYAPFLQNLKIFKTTLDMSKAYSSGSVPRLVSFEYQRLLTHGGMTAARADVVANSRVHLLFLAVFIVITVILLWGVRDYRSMVASAAALSLVWFLTSTYVLPWYLTMGLMLAAVLGWSLTTACLVGAAAVSTLYLIPWPPGGYPSGPTMYLCVPFLLLLVGWLTLTLMRRYSGSGAVVPAPPPAEATEEI
jgi:hypothetical protein